MNLSDLIQGIYKKIPGEILKLKHWLLVKSQIFLVKQKKTKVSQKYYKIKVH